MHIFGKSLWKIPIRWIAVLIVRHLQRRYKSLTIKNRYSQSNRIIAKLILIQSILYYFKAQFSAWGFFHPSCVWSAMDEAYYDRIFPEKEDFEELEIVVWYNPEAVTYYRNIIYAHKNSSPHALDIKRQLKKWKNWN